MSYFSSFIYFNVPYINELPLKTSKTNQIPCFLKVHVCTHTNDVKFLNGVL